MQLARAYRTLGRTADAEKLFLAAGSAYEKSWPSTDLPPAHAEACLALADIYRNRGDYARAARLQDGARERFKKLLGQGNGRYAAALLQSGRLRVAMGDLSRAEVFFRELVEIRDKYFGKETVEYAEAIEGLANVLQLASKPQEAEGLYLKALELTKPAEGGVASWANIRVRNELGRLYHRTGKLDKAAEVFRRAWKITARLSGPTIPTTPST